MFSYIHSSLAFFSAYTRDTDAIYKVIDTLIYRRYYSLWLRIILERASVKKCVNKFRRPF